MTLDLSKLRAIIISLLMVISVVAAPVTASPTNATPTHEINNQTTDANSSAHARSLALQRLQDTNSKQTDSLTAKLNSTRSFYTDSNHTTAPTFDVDRRIAAKTKDDAITTRLLESDSILATKAVNDATRVFEAYQDTAGFDTDSVSHHIQKAQDALEKGEDLRTKDSLGAFAQYERAWYQSQKALDKLDAAIDPDISITTREDPAHSDTITYRIAGNVTDARNHDLSNVTILINGETTTVPLQRTTKPNGTSHFETQVALDQRVNNITVTVTDPGTTYATRHSPLKNTGDNSNKKKDSKKNGKQQKNNGNSEETTDTDPVTSSTSLFLDGDKLPDVYETAVTNTGPLDPNSNSSRTTTDESANQLLDGDEDFDEDQLRTAIEYQQNLNPFNPDTDGDRLTDRFELDYTQLNGTRVDTDADGTPDSNEDFDDDGLPNLLEQRYQTNPHDADTDSDGLPDGYEANTTLTVPTDPDSNSSRTQSNESDDGVTDSAEDFDDETLTTGTEHQIGTNPFVVDTDGDNLTDAFEYTYDPLNPLSIDSNDDGIRDNNWDIDEDTLVNEREQALTTNPVNPDTDGDTLRDDYEVQVTLTSPIRRDSNSSRTELNESGNNVIDGREDFDDDGLETTLESNISTDPFDKDSDDDRLTDPFEYQWGNISPLQADSDGDNTTDDLENPDQDGLTHYLEQRYGTNPFIADTDGDTLEDGVETNTTKTHPLRPDSNSERTQRNEANNSIIDGSEDFDQDGVSTATEVELGLEPFDSDTDNDGLRDGFELQYDKLSATSNDTDGDGVPDAFEDFDEDNLTNSQEQRFGTHPHLSDTDGDSLTDWFELAATGTDPTLANSDSAATDENESEDSIPDGATDLTGDNLTNAQEQELGTEPLLNDTDGDGLPDGYEVNVVGMDPLSTDSSSPMTSTNESGNGIGDGQEDLDGDTLSLLVEYQLGTDPTSNDTDGDGLSDAFEYTYDALSPVTVDTDGDGTTDDETDLESDGLTNAREATLNTSPILSDTDGDGLTDYNETSKYPTSPTNPDTDGDGILDGQEIALGTDPMSADTDSDGITDGNETMKTTTTDEETNVSVSVSGEGNIAGSVSIENHPTYQEENPARASSVVQINVDEDVDQGTITIPITNETDAGRISDLAIYTFDRDRGMWTRTKTQYNGSAGTLSTSMSDGVYYTIYNVTAWERATSVTLNTTPASEQSYTCQGECTVDDGAIAIGPNGTPSTTEDAETQSATERISILGVGDQDGDDDSDGDGVLNNEDNCVSTSNPDQSDTDGDGIGDACDDVYDTDDDADDDGVADDTDNCKNTKNADQADSDGDGVGDACDTSEPDADGDGIADDTDNCQNTPNVDQADADGDGVGDACETSTGGGGGGGDETEDTDGDGVNDQPDNCENTPNAEQANQDGDSDGDACDSNIDGDQYPNTDDNCPKVDHESQQNIDRDAEGAPCDSDEPLYGGTEYTLEVPDDVNSVVVYIQYSANAESSVAAPATVTISGEDYELKTKQLDATLGRQQSVEIPVEYFASDTLTIEISGTEDANLKLYSVDVLTDTDEDGLYNMIEKQSFYAPDLEGGLVTTDPATADTDQDKLNDGREVSFSLDCAKECRGGPRNRYIMPIEVTANPTKADTDDDGLTDYYELVADDHNVVRYEPTASGDRKEWNPSGSDFFHATSDPMLDDTDGDGLTDKEEQALHTDPEARVTYAITETQRRVIYDRLREMPLQKRLHYAQVLNLPCTASQFCEQDGARFKLRPLTDATADFDYVRPDGSAGSTLRENLEFVALDGVTRTDTWVSNQHELRVLETNPWDADTDNDGLTDGQEAYFINGPQNWQTRGGVPASYNRTLDPTDPDTDDDGFWDGWIGVYGTDQSENLILYREHLQSGRVRGDAAIPDQQGVHEVNGLRPGKPEEEMTSSALTADIDDDGVPEHSNVHVGELHWGTSPTDTLDEPNPGITLEVGFHTESKYKVWNTQNGQVQSQWLQDVKKNYALYDIDVTVVEKEVIEKDEMPPMCDGCLDPTETPRYYTADSPMSEKEVIATIGKHQNPSYFGSAYLLVANKPDFEFSSNNIGGWNLFYAGGNYRDEIGQLQGMIVFSGQYPSATAARSTAMHEIAHSFQIGENDDSCERAGILTGGEIYSGTDDDRTQEEIAGEEEWSIMTSGSGKLIDNQYHVFSIEELFTVENSLRGDYPCGDA